MIETAISLIPVVLPIGLAVTAGWLLGRYKSLNPRPLADAGVYVFTPALLVGKVPTDLAERGSLALMLMTVTVLLLIIGFTIAKYALRMRDRDERAAIGLGIGLSNFGFFGLPLAVNAFGQDAYPMAITILTFLNIPTGILAVYLCSPQPTFKAAVRDTARIPLTWAVIIAMALGVIGIELPPVVAKPLNILGEGAIPCMLLVLGIELSRLSVKRFRPTLVTLAVSLRLLLPLPLVLGISLLLNLELSDLAVQSAALQLSTPAGITPLMLMAAFGRKTDLLAAIILASTVLSMLTLPVVLTILRAL